MSRTAWIVLGMAAAAVAIYFLFFRDGQSGIFPSFARGTSMPIPNRGPTGVPTPPPPVHNTSGQSFGKNVRSLFEANFDIACGGSGLKYGPEAQLVCNDAAKLFLDVHEKAINVGIDGAKYVWNNTFGKLF